MGEMGPNVLRFTAINKKPLSTLAQEQFIGHLGHIGLMGPVVAARLILGRESGSLLAI